MTLTNSSDGGRIFLAGASGMIGQRLIPRLVQAGHVVGGLTRSPSKTDLLSHLGAEPILCDVFNRHLSRRFVTSKPDVVLNELTDLPDDAAQISPRTDLNARIRTEGNRNLIEAARRAPVLRRATRPTRASKERRITSKVRQGRNKQLRGRVRGDD